MGKTKFKHILEKLHETSEFRKFKKENPDSYLCAGFFIIDKDKKTREQDQVDYYLPKTKKIETFILGKGKVEMKESETIKKDVIPEMLDKEVLTDIESLWQRVDDAMKDNNVSSEIQKLIAIIQNINEKNIWNITCMLSGLSILKMHLSDEDASILKFEKMNLIDFSSKGQGSKPDYIQ
jgi:hypothetical protein